MFSRAHASFPAIAPHAQGLVGPMQLAASHGCDLEKLEQVAADQPSLKPPAPVCVSVHKLVQPAQRGHPSVLHEEDGRPVVRLRLASGPLISCWSKAGNGAGHPREPQQNAGWCVDARGPQIHELSILNVGDLAPHGTFCDSFVLFSFWRSRCNFQELQALRQLSALVNSRQRSVKADQRDCTS